MSTTRAHDRLSTGLMWYSRFIMGFAGWAAARLITSRYEPEKDTVSIIQSAKYTTQHLFQFHSGSLSLWILLAIVVAVGGLWVWLRAYGLKEWVSDVASVMAFAGIGFFTRLLPLFIGQAITYLIIGAAVVLIVSAVTKSA